jgi:Protein of unknown function (DUF2917)
MCGMTTSEGATESSAKSWADLRAAAVAAGKRVLPRGGLLHMEVSAGGGVRCLEGCVWITADTTSGDIVLKSGESRQFARRSCVLVEALEDSRVRLGV